MSNIDYFRTWQGLINFLHQTNRFASLQKDIFEQEKLPLTQREITIMQDNVETKLKVFYDTDFITYLKPNSPYPSWIWNESTGQWDPPKPRPTNPATEYDLLWNEDTQGWGLENMSLSKLNDNGTHVVERKYFDTWDNLIKYLHSIDQIKNVYRQIVEQEKLELLKRKIISPYHDKFICLQILES